MWELIIIVFSMIVLCFPLAFILVMCIIIVVDAWRGE